MTPWLETASSRRHEQPHDLAAEKLSDREPDELSEMQEAYRKAYVFQLRVRQFPGCGVTELF